MLKMAWIRLDLICEVRSVCWPQDRPNCQTPSVLCTDVKRRAQGQMEAKHVLRSSSLWEISFVNADMRNSSATMISFVNP